MNKQLIKFIKFIGSVAFTAIIYAFPVLLTCSMVFSWIPIIKIMLILINIYVFMVICSVVFDAVDD